MSRPEPVRVSLGERSYDVLVGRDLFGSLCQFVHDIRIPQRVHIFEDGGLPLSVREAASASFERVQVSRSVYQLDESTKSLATLHRMLVDLAEAQLERTDVVIALGGGILGDVAGLAGGLHRRGVSVVQCPTTLLSMVDASVGGKTGVNMDATINGAPVMLKNAAGLFHQPVLVVADVNVMDTLPQRERRCGLAECIKHSLIAGRKATEALRLDAAKASMRAVLEGDWSSVAGYVRENVALKAQVVAADEHESAEGDRPGRRALNLGHTFAHAIEACGQTRVDVDGQPLHPAHGEAVGLGLLAAARLAEVCLNVCDELRATVQNALSSVGLPTRLVQSPEPAELIAAMRQDKKARSGQLRLVLPIADGVIMMDDPGDEALQRAWTAIT